MSHFMYHINYQDYEEDLCALEMRALFNRSITDKVFFSDKAIDASISPYVKSRLEVSHEASSLETLLHSLNEGAFVAQAFKVKYVPVIKRDPVDKERQKICKEVGHAIIGQASFDQPETVFGVTCHEAKWYFGVVTFNNIAWKAHIRKPFSYSSSLGINTAKAILNIAARGDLSKRIIDPCCGVGTVLLEGHIANYDITGCEIKDKVAMKARQNLIHFGYEGRVMISDIKDIEEAYDGAVVDLPYGNFSHSDETNMMNIIRHARRIAKRQVIVSSIDLTQTIIEERLTIVDRCVVYKNKSRQFIRYVWVCE